MRDVYVIQNFVRQRQIFAVQDMLELLQTRRPEDCRDREWTLPAEGQRHVRRVDVVLFCNIQICTGRRPNPFSLAPAHRRTKRHA